MLISCNKLKKHLENSDSIDWVSIWDKFSIRTAEVEGVQIKGNDIDGVVVAQILECEKVENSKKLHKLLVDNGNEHIQIICGAPNVRVGLKAPLVNIGGHVCGMKITKRKLAGEESFGMMCSAEELGFAENCEGILELPDNYEVGRDIKDYLPIEDIIVEIDNKSLTNRPDLWGHYGIAREISAITGLKLKKLTVEDIPNDKEDLDIKVNSDLCSRYTGLKIENITNTETPFDMQIFLYYTGMRSKSLIIDLTNYLMLELGQPMHAFDARKINRIEVDLANDKDEFVTLDNEKRVLSDKMLMIKNDDEYFAIAGVMGGLDSEILDDTTSIVLESANFNAASVRRTATSLGLRTEASARYEKSLDPNMTLVAAKRFVYLLRQFDPDIEITSNLTDVYVNKLEKKEIILQKKTIKKYMGKDIESSFIINVLTSLGFKVEEYSDNYKVIVPTYRATKDISLEADLIEEIARLYGYENIELKPLKLDLTFGSLENIQEIEYEVKRLLATKFNMNEVHTYLWYKTAMLEKLNITKDNIRLLGKSNDNTLRDDLGLSLIDVVKTNLKTYSNVNVFEIGTEFIDGENKRSLAFALADNYKNLEKMFYQAKLVLQTLFKIVYNKNVNFVKSSSYDYYDKSLTFDCILDNDVVGSIKVVNSNISVKIAKKKSIVIGTIDFDKFVTLQKNDYIYEPISKYPSVTLDYTILMDKNNKYEYLNSILNEFKSPIIKERLFIDKYDGEIENKYTIRYIVGSNEKTLTNEELQDFKNKFIEHIKKNGLNIIE